MKKQGLFILGLSVLLLNFVDGYQQEATALTAAEFYKGKTVKVLLRTDPASPTGLLAQTFAKLMSEKTGATFVTQFITGGGGIEALNSVWRSNPDGLTLGMEDFTSLVSNDIFASPGYQPKADKIDFIAKVGNEVVIFYVRPGGPIKSFSDLKVGKGLKFASTTPAGMRTINLMVVAYILDLDAKVVTGLRGNAGVDLAIARGEADACISAPGAVLKGLKSGTHHPLFSLDTMRSSAIPDVPAVTELVKIPKEKLEILNVMLTLRPGKAIWLRPGVPKDRLDFLRSAFTETAKRQDFKAVTGKILGYSDYEIVSGEETAATAKEAISSRKIWKETFQSLLDRYRL